jgi:murein DD-endopeptidase MepM/ murein hydrolase activator NlpD
VGSGTRALALPGPPVTTSHQLRADPRAATETGITRAYVRPVSATSSPPTPLIATVACALCAALPAPLAVPATAVAMRWQRPVPGDVARPFSYERSTPFVAGAHRGVDLRAAPGTVVLAACSGAVVHASAVAGRERVVSTSCGYRRVSYLPLASIAVRKGGSVGAGAPIGTVAAGHGGLHVGVRRASDRFAYLDPMTLFAAPARPFAPASRRVGPRLVPRMPLPRARAAEPATRPLVTTGPASPAPWPVWAGLGLVLFGAAGSGTIAVRWRDRARAGVRATSTA